MNVRRLHLCSILAASLLLPALAVHAAGSRPRWTDSGASFSAGTLGNSGQNLYLNRRGELETIRRYDLDGNGHLDLLFNSSHDSYNAIPATLATADGRKLKATELGVDGSSRILVHDLNRDGLADLVFMPNHQNVQKQRSSIMIAWGGSDGWDLSRLSRQLPVNAVSSLAIGDLNNDGWPDLLTLNSEGWLFRQPEGKIVRVYWGSADGYLLSRYQDLGIPGAVEIATGGFGTQREFPAVVLTGNGTLHFLSPEAKSGQLTSARSVELALNSTPAVPVNAQALLAQAGPDRTGDTLWVSTNTASLFQVATATAEPTVKTIRARPATHLAAGRLDGDEWPDLVLTDLKPVYSSAKSAPAPPSSITILWGDREGVSAERQTALAIPNAFSTAVGDLNTDGQGDLAVAVYQGEQSNKASSLVFLGDGSRRLPAPGLPVATEGAQGVAIARLTPDAPPVAVFANSQRRTLADAVPLRLYWGVPGGFSRDTFVDIPNLSGYKSSASDLNSDGYVDMIVINGGDISEEAAARAPHAGANIYWGGQEGSLKGPGPTRFDPSRRQILPEKHLGSINVADLNHDGYLDLVLGSFESAGRLDTQMVIYYGAADGFSANHRKAISVPGRSIGCLIADYNRDGDLDIVIGFYRDGNLDTISGAKSEVITYWGRAGDYSEQNKTVLPYPTPVDLEAADFNGDGWLDLIVASYEDSVAHHRDTGLTIFQGGPAGWHQSRSQWLPGMTPLGLAVADLDGDGFLDLVSPHYHGELSREQLPSYIYWGSGKGFAPLNRTPLVVNSGSDVVIADFNGDGKLDLAFVAHSVDAGHQAESPVYFNDGKRFASPAVQYLPAAGPHYMWVQDIGNIYHRRNEENFTSRVLAWEEACRSGRIEIDAATPFGSRVGLNVRSAADQAALGSAPWRNVAGNSFAVAAGDRAFQYRLDLISANGDAYPLVRKIDIQLK